MPTEAHLISWLEHLWQLFPAQGVLIVGAGNGTSPWIDALQRWNAPNVTLIEADDTQFQYLQHTLMTREGWQLHKQVVAAETGSVAFHHASNPAESGLVEPENLRPLWPNLKTLHISKRQAISLAELLAGTKPAANWLLIDCLPAGALLSGAGRALATFDVIVTRTLLPEAGADISAAQADANSITQLLKAHGLRTVTSQASRHPRIQHAVWVRDVVAETKAKETALAQVHALKQETLELVKAREAETQAKLAEAQAKKEAFAQVQALQQEMAELIQAKNNELKDKQKELEKSQTINESKKNFTPLTSCLFSIETWIHDRNVIPLNMNTTRSDWVNVNERSIEFQTKDGAPLYLVSNEGGNFNRPPRNSQIFIQQGGFYILSGQISHKGSTRPQIYVFQYDKNSRIESNSQIIDADGRFLIRFEAQSSASSVAIGVRLAGHGRLDLTQTRLCFREDVNFDIIYSINDKLKALEGRQHRDIENAVLQIESFIRLQNYLGPSILIPNMHGWPISPDFAMLLVELIECNSYDAVIEFGSGSSTLVLAKALDCVARRIGEVPAPLVSFDHLIDYHKKTHQLLENANLHSNTKVHLAPLVSWRDEVDNEYLYYSCDEALMELRTKIQAPYPKLLVVVDGPPASTGPLARFPAMSKVVDIFGKKCQLNFLMDDYSRTDEQKIILHWETELSRQARNHRRTVFNKLEKHACLLEVFHSTQINEE